MKTFACKRGVASAIIRANNQIKYDKITYKAIKKDSTININIHEMMMDFNSEKYIYLFKPNSPLNEMNTYCLYLILTKDTV